MILPFAGDVGGDALPITILHELARAVVMNGIGRHCGPNVETGEELTSTEKKE